MYKADLYLNDRGQNHRTRYNVQTAKWFESFEKREH